jgi:hypothetical protein
MAFGEAVDDIGEIGFGVEPIQFCGLKNGIENGRPVAAGLGAEEQEILPGQGDTSQSSLGWIVVYADASVAGVKRQGIPAIERISQGLARPLVRPQSLQPPKQRWTRGGSAGEWIWKSGTAGD